MMDKQYVDTVRLLLETAPVIFQSSDFALKGGTAINLFVRDMPRLSVDLDVVFTNRSLGREEALSEISRKLQDCVDQLQLVGIKAEPIRTRSGDEVKILAQRANNLVKIEVNFVFRGTVLPAAPRRLSNLARDLFTTDLVLPALDEAELYGSKLVAALDRQHPRDFFDVLGLFQHEGLTPMIVECFVCYLAGHNRPIHEVLFSRDIDLAISYDNEFLGMTKEEVALSDLIAARARLRTELPSSLTNSHKHFLLSLAAGKPDWSLMSCPHLQEMPAIRWKVENLAKLKRINPEKFLLQSEELMKRLDG